MPDGPIQTSGPRGPAVIGPSQPCPRKSSISRLSSSACVAAKPCGAPAITSSRALRSILAARRGTVVRHDLVGVAMRDQDGDVDPREVGREIRLAEGGDAALGREWRGRPGDPLAEMHELPAAEPLAVEGGEEAVEEGEPVFP